MPENDQAEEAKYETYADQAEVERQPDEQELNLWRKKLGTRLQIICAIVVFGIFHAYFNGPIQAITMRDMRPPQHLLKNHYLEGVNKMSVVQGEEEMIKLNGPESLVVTDDGKFMFVSLNDGSVVRLEKETNKWYRVTFTGNNKNIERYISDCSNNGGKKELFTFCGRPMGMVMADAEKLKIMDQLPANSEKEVLIVLDAYGGIFVVSNPRTLAPGRTRLGPTLAKGDYYNFRFLNSITVSNKGDALYFTESTNVHTYSNYMLNILSGRQEGRVIEWKNNEARVAADKLFFPNGIEFSTDEKGKDIFIVCTGWEVQRFGFNETKDVPRNFVPGFCDNINKIPKDKENLPVFKGGKFFVGLPVKYVQPYALEYYLAFMPWIRTAMAAFIPVDYLMYLQDWIKPKYGLVAILNNVGKVVATLQDPSGESGFFCDAVIFGDYLYLGSYRNEYLGVVPLSQLTTRTTTTSPNQEL